MGKLGSGRRQRGGWRRVLIGIVGGSTGEILARARAMEASERAAREASAARAANDAAFAALASEAARILASIRQRKG